MEYDEMDDEMEMPCPCQRCGKWFDLTDGIGSEKWYPETVICRECGQAEQIEIEKDEEIKELKEQIDDAKETIKDCRDRLMGLGIEVPTIIWCSFY